jgi:UDP-N-acetyl-D-mannosaminuronic acid dehydrogenase
MNGDGEKTEKVVSVVGGAGHVGLPFCLILANNGYKVHGIDINESMNKLIMQGSSPFTENNVEQYLNNALGKRLLFMSSDFSKISESDVVVIVLGTPVDDNLNPSTSALLEMFDDNSKFFRKNQLIVLRSTVSPGTTELIKKRIERNTGYIIGNDIFLVYAPERVLQGKAIEELQSLPQPIGAFDDKSYLLAEEFFLTFLRDKCFKMTCIEAELGKLIANMTRYVNFALANEYYLIAESFGANIHKVIDVFNYHYPRLNLPSPGPNVGGPCLYKDGWFIVERIPFNELISTAFRVNEGMTMQIVSKLEKISNIKKVTILGLAFKPGSDDTRNSLSFKLNKQLKRNDYDITLIDPFVENCTDITRIQNSDAIVLMTPHKEFGDLRAILDMVANDNCVYVDIWGFWKEMKYKSNGGYFFGREARSEYSGMR